MKLEDKIIVITGAASGIGKACAILFAREGAKVVIADINVAGGKKVEREIKNFDQEAFFVKCDVTKPSQIKNLIEAVLKKYKNIDILINNVGIYLHGRVEKMRERDFNRLIDINLKGPFFCSKYVIPIMKKKKSGIIINISSGLGIVAEPESPAYCASKAGLINLTRSMALEYTKYGIRVNCVCPGPIDTPLLRKSFPNKKGLENYIQNHTLVRRLGEPEEVAKVILFLASEDSSYVIGSTYSVDGGEAL
jgi:NAD(P)-dependent dehydrogenase (short-subunit alcohol dehydrogenase family)